jgi:hypothetical protein
LLPDDLDRSNFPKKDVKFCVGSMKMLARTLLGGYKQGRSDALHTAAIKGDVFRLQV